MSKNLSSSLHIGVRSFWYEILQRGAGHYLKTRRVWQILCMIWREGMGQRSELTFGNDVVRGVGIMANEFDRDLKQLVRRDVAENIADQRLSVGRRFDGVSGNLVLNQSRPGSGENVVQGLPLGHWVERL